MYSLIEDLATITTIPVASLQKLTTKAQYCICNDMVENKLKNENLTEINIGIGTLQINVADNKMQYRFIPNDKFEKALKESWIDGKCTLKDELDRSLIFKILNTYKTIL